MYILSYSNTSSTPHLRLVWLLHHGLYIQLEALEWAALFQIKVNLVNKA